MFVKVCGVRCADELEVVEKHADATGVVVMCKSKRAVDLEVARDIVERSKIPVFLVSTVKEFSTWERIISRVEPKYVQIHTDEISPDDVERIRDLGVFVAKAFKIPRFSDNPEEDAKRILERIGMYNVDMILLDTGSGTGITHDHRVSRIIARRFDVVLAGGLNPENVCEVVEFVRPYGVDVSSGVERNGRKDEELVSRFVRNAKRCLYEVR